MFGAFVGYNAQYGKRRLRFEGNYMHGTFTGVATAEHIDTTFNPVSIPLRHGSMTLRVRGGYTMSNFMPYLFAGFSSDAPIPREA